VDRQQRLRRRSVAFNAAVVAVAASLGTAIAADARSPLAGTARLQGQFQLTGRITVARHVRGERLGQIVLRSWTFTPLCALPACETVALTRQRAAGTDSLVLHIVSTDLYTGTGSFYAPLRCGGRTVLKGESVPFTISVQITNASVVNGVPAATELTASYTNSRRTNLTRCVAAPGHDAAVYRGSLTNPASPPASG
jgi:hypothetical protein